MLAAARVHRHFNPRSREGSDMQQIDIALQIALFQSTLPRGERQRSSRQQPKAQNFNPRSREGSDKPLSPCSAKSRQDFNPRSREGSDDVFAGIGIYNILFQSTLPRGERQTADMVHHITPDYFNPRSREGSDKKGRRNQVRRLNFNPRSREGSDSFRTFMSHQ